MSVHQPLLEKKQTTFLQRHLGAIYMAIAAYGSSYITLGIKLLDRDGVPVPQMLLMRNLLILLGLFGVNFHLKPQHGILGPPKIRGLLLTRALVGNTSLLLSMVALTLLPLGDAVALYLISPAITLLLSPIILNEAFGFKETIPLIMSTSGVLLIARPPFLFAHSSRSVENVLGMVLAIAGAIFASTCDLLVRKIGGRAHLIHLLFYFSFVAFVPSFMWCLLNRDELIFTNPVAMHTLVMTLGALVAQVFMARSLRIEKVSRIAPIVSLQLVFAFINDWLFFDVTPPLPTLAAAGLIASAAVIASLYQ
ncbi:hypothetical protein DSO57_1015009 [Entomophthora muscae]|uniref:Uncharacterized protein n=1 Tax=Entomophthora muscae TaxID=34485 RepID=A0ACC2RJU6_9FUNG|nr:hypothetical protein DSO57_1015009 [Entomophthora muscae]